MKFFLGILMLLMVTNGFSSNKEYNNFKIIKLLNFDIEYHYQNKEKNFYAELDEEYKIYKEPGKGLIFNSCFFLNKNVVIITEWDGLLYYDLENNKIIRWLKFNVENKIRINSQYQVVGIKKNTNYDLFIFAYGILYNYDFKDNKLHVIYDQFDEIIKKFKIGVFASYANYREFTNPVYNAKRNSIIFSAYNLKGEEKITKYSIWEFDLKDYSLIKINSGYCPVVNNRTNKVYYIDDKNRNIIMQMDLDTYENKRIAFKYRLPIYQIYFNNSATRMVFIHRKLFKNIKGNYDTGSKLVDLRKNKITSFSDEFLTFPSDLIFPEDIKE